MATVNVVIGQSSNKHDENVPVILPEQSQTITSSTQSQTFTIRASAIKSLSAVIAEVTVTGNNIYVSFGESPTAVSGQGALILNGQTRYYRLFAGQTLAVIDA